MKRKFNIVTIFILSLIIVTIIYFIPRKIDMTLTGLQYQLDIVNADNIEVVIISLEGKVSVKNFKKNYFSGRLTFKIGETEKSTNCNIHLNSKGGHIFLMDEIIFEGKKLGLFFANRDFSEITITLSEINSENFSSSWNDRDGYVLSAPAKTRDEALLLANKLMNKFLNEHCLE